MAVIVGMLIMLVIILSALFSCTAKERVVTEYVAVHDTIHSHHTDTLREVSYKVRVDTVWQHETHTITLNNVGDTIKEIHHYHDIEKVIVVDSTNKYIAKIDSLQKALVSEKEKHITKKKTKIKWWEWAIFFGFVVILLYGIGKIKS